MHIFTHIFHMKNHIFAYIEHLIYTLFHKALHIYMTYVSFMVGLCFTYLLFMYNLCKIYVSHMFRICFTYVIRSYSQKIRSYDICGSQAQHVFHKSNKALFSNNKILLHIWITSATYVSQMQ